MTPDPLEDLRLPIVPVEPRPEFADALLRQMGLRERWVAVPSATPTVRYFVDDVDIAVGFYCRVLDFEVELHQSPLFAMLYRGELRLLLSVPGSAHVLSDGTLPRPGGSNRMALQVEDLADVVNLLSEDAVHFRTDIVTGVGVRQVLLEDPSGNLVELFEPIAGYHERPRDPVGEPSAQKRRLNP